MKYLRADAARRWLAVGGGLLAVSLLPAAIGALPAIGAPEVAPDELKTAILASAPVPHQGYAVATGSLGLPDVSPLQQVAALLSSTTRLRVWWEGATTWRIDKLDLIGETDTYRSRGRTIVWSSNDRSAVVRPSMPPLRLPEATDLEPGELARRILTSADGDRVERLDPTRVAGKSVPGLRVRPSDPASTIDHVDVWADAATGVALRVEVTGVGASHPSLSSSYEEIEIGRSDAMPFQRAPDAHLERADSGDIATRIDQFAPYRLPDELAGRPRRDVSTSGLLTGGVGVYGNGLAAIVVVPLLRDTGFKAFAQFAVGQQVVLDRPGSDARSVSTPLLNAELVQAGRRFYLVAGTVNVDELTRAAQQLVDVPPPENTR